jgi:hypothetical protein
MIERNGEMNRRNTDSHYVGKLNQTQFLCSQALDVAASNEIDDCKRMAVQKRRPGQTLALFCKVWIPLGIPYALARDRIWKATEDVFRLNFTGVDRSTRNKIAANDTHSQTKYCLTCFSCKRILTNGLTQSVGKWILFAKCFRPDVSMNRRT